MTGCVIAIKNISLIRSSISIYRVWQMQSLDVFLFLFLLILGDLFDEEEVLEWLTNPENMEMDDAIERVNKRMFERILAKSEYLTVFFCEFFF